MRRIVVVEASAELRHLFTELLVDAGYGVALATTPPVALEPIADVQPDMIILGYLYGREVEGWQLFHALGQHAELARVPVLVGMERRAGAAVRAVPGRVVKLLNRPFALDDFLNAVHALLAQSR